MRHALPAVGLFCALSLAVLAAGAPAAASINYNASKSNTGNKTFHPGGAKGQPGMAVKGSGVAQSGAAPQNKTTGPANPK